VKFTKKQKKPIRFSALPMHVSHGSKISRKNDRVLIKCNLFILILIIVNELPKTFMTYYVDLCAIKM
jgi:hypothetical protein